MKMKTKLFSAACVLGLCALPALAADSLTVVSWGGAYQDSVRKAFFEPFMKDSGDKIVEEEFNGEIAKIRAMVESGNVTWDVVENDSQTTMASCAEGIVEKIDWKSSEVSVPLVNARTVSRSDGGDDGSGYSGCPFPG